MRLSSSSSSSSSSGGAGEKPNTASTMLIDGTQSQKSWLPRCHCYILSVLPFLLCLLLLFANLIRITVLVIFEK